MPRVCITVPGKNAQPYRFSLERKIVRLGRAADNDIIIDCPSVSSHHCEMRRVEGGYVLQDLDSTNGITVDGDRMETIDLENDSEVRVGDAALDFELSSEELAELGEENHTPQNRRKLPPATEDAGDEAREPEEMDDMTGGTSGDEGGKDRPRKTKKKAPAPERPREPAPAAQPGGGLNFLISLIFIALAVAVFFSGMSLKHEANWPGRSLWHDLRGTEQPEPAPAPVDEDGGGDES